LEPLGANQLEHTTNNYVFPSPPVPSKGHGSIGETQVILGNTILDKNVKKEKDLSEKDEKGHYLLCISINAGYNNHGSGKAYNSDSGHHITVGNCFSLMVVLHHMSKHCSKCELGEKTGKKSEHDSSLCACNYHGSSKGMKAHDALQSCTHLHKHHNVMCKIIVMDDDSSMENILK
jgi:hypothetical protein